MVFAYTGVMLGLVAEVLVMTFGVSAFVTYLLNKE